mgnify:CR=1 FL=1
MDSYTMDKMIIPVWEWGEALDFIAHKYPFRYKDFAQSIAKNQWKSKTWLIENLSMINDEEEPEVWVLGSWYGSVIVPLIMHHIPNVKKIHLFDYDKEAIEICYKLHSKWNKKIKRYHADINFEIDLLKSYENQPDIVINTSCEHMWNMKDLKLEGNILYAFQSNNFTPETAHINCPKNLEDFKNQVELKEIEFEGEIPFHDHKDDYKRFLLIGW